jgi:hypothetical protein
MGIYQFMSDSPFLSAFLIYVIGECVLKLGARVLRSINIAARGWPPEHLDADGDWKPQPTKETP